MLQSVAECCLSALCFKFLGGARGLDFGGPWGLLVTPKTAILVLIILDHRQKSTPPCYGPGSKNPEFASEEQLADGGGVLRGCEVGEFAMGALVLPLFVGVLRVGGTRPDDGSLLGKRYSHPP